MPKNPPKEASPQQKFEEAAVDALRSANRGLLEIILAALEEEFSQASTVAESMKISGKYGELFEKMRVELGRLGILTSTVLAEEKDIPIRNLRLPASVVKEIEAGGIHTLDQLIQDHKKVHFPGSKVQDVETALEAMGYQLRATPKEL